MKEGPLQMDLRNFRVDKPFGHFLKVSLEEWDFSKALCPLRPDFKSYWILEEYMEAAFLCITTSQINGGPLDTSFLQGFS